MTRALAHAAVDEESKGRLRRLQAMADPVALLAEIRAAQAELGERVDRRGMAAANEPSSVGDLAGFTASLKTAWKEGERRKTHRRPYRRRKPAPKRFGMLDDLQSEIHAWLDCEPAISALEVLRRLKMSHPDRFTDKHLRTVQRTVKIWRGEQARRILDASRVIKTAIPEDDPPIIPPPPGSSTGIHRDRPRIASSAT